MKILIVIDMQNDFVIGSLANKDAENIIPNIAAKLEKYNSNTVKRKHDLLIFTKDTHGYNYLTTQEGENLPVMHCLADTRGWDIVDELRKYATRNRAKIIEKNTFGSYDLVETINDFSDDDDSIIESIELCGVCTDICVVTNALLIKTAYPEVPIIVDASCCAGLTPEKHKAALEVMKSCQIKIINEEN